MAFPAPTKSIRFFRLHNLTFIIGVVGIGNTVRRGTLHAVCLLETQFSPSLVKLMVRPQ